MTKVSIDLPAEEIVAGDVIYAWGFDYPVASVSNFPKIQITHIYLMVNGREELSKPIHSKTMLRVKPRG